MALDTLKCNHLMPLGLKGLNQFGVQVLNLKWLLMLILKITMTLTGEPPKGCGPSCIALPVWPR